MIRSMTAFVRIPSATGPRPWVVEIRSLNHRYFEFSLKAPPYLYSLENRIREHVQKNIQRGKVTLTISQNSEEKGIQKVDLDDEVVTMYLGAIRRLKAKYKLKGDATVQDLIQLPQIFAVDRLREEAPEKTWKSLESVLNRAVVRAIAVKEAEGRKLLRDILGRLGKVKKAVTRIQAHAKGQWKRNYTRLKSRVNELIQEREKDRDRFYREVAFLVERSDITEEIVRLKSHLGAFAKRLNSKEAVGRQLDFLCQEMNREVNTMGAKAQLFDISQETVFIKGELEKIREQIQNIE